MNAGAHGIALGDFVQESTVMDHQGILRCLTPKEHQFSYRTSIFQQKNLIVLETLFNTLPRHPDEALQTIATSKEKRKQLPLLPSCGSTFRNPEGRYAGKIIEELGLKGAQIGQAQISPIHANFIVNLGGASAQEVYSLIRLVQQKAANHEITLETEVRLWGQFD